MQDIEVKIKINTAESVNSLTALDGQLKTTANDTNNATQATEQLDSSYKTFKTQLREANQELMKVSQTFGATSQEAKNAAQKVANLKDEMQFSKDLVTNLNPDQKFKALGAATQVASTAMVGVTGAMGLFGDSSKETQAMLLKVQSAMAFSQAVSGLSDLGDQFKILKTLLIGEAAAASTATSATVGNTVATEVNSGSKQKLIVSEVIANATKEAGTALTFGQTIAITAQTIATNVATVATNVLNASLAALFAPISIIIGVIALLTTGVLWLTGAIGDMSGEKEKSANATKKLAKEIASLSKEFDKTNKALEDHNEHQIAMAKASGKSSEEVRKLTLDLAKQEEQLKLTNYQLINKKLIEAKGRFKDDDSDENKANYDTALEANKKAVGLVNESRVKIRKIEGDNEVARTQEKTDANAKLADKQQKHLEDVADKEKKAGEKRVEDAKKLSEDLANAVKKGHADIENLNAKTDEQKLALQKTRDQEEIDAIKARGGNVLELQKIHNNEYAILEANLTAKNADEKNKKELDEQNKNLEKANNEKLSFDERLVALQDRIDAEQKIIFANDEAKLAYEKANADASNKIKLDKEAEVLNVANDPTKDTDARLEAVKQREEAESTIIFENQDARTKYEKENAAARIGIANTEQEAKKKLLKAVGALLGEAANQAGKDTQTGKALAVASSLINTYQGITAELATKTVTPYEIGLKVANVAVIASTGFSAVKNILATPVPGGGGGGGGGGGSMSLPTASAPSANIVAPSGVNQLATTLGGQPPIKAFVVSHDVTTQQGLDRNIVTNATLG